MAALLAGARLFVRQGVRFLPVCTVRAPSVSSSNRYLIPSARFLTSVVQNKGPFDAESVALAEITQVRMDEWSLRYISSRLKHSGRITKNLILNTFNDVCKEGKHSSNLAWFLLKACGNSMAGEIPAERTEMANTIWRKMQELGVVFDERHYKILLKVYLENEHKFSPAEFLADMEAAQVQPDQTTYQELITAYCNEGDIEGASKILGFMKSNNFPITEEIFNSLILGHARAGDMESAKNILSVMQSAGLVPGRGTHIALLCAYAEKGDIESIKQTLDSSKRNLSCKEFLKVIFALTKAGNSHLVPDMLEQMETYQGYNHDVTNICLALLAQGYGDTAILLIKKFFPVQQHLRDFDFQPGTFFLRQCVYLNKPINDLKKYAAELKESGLHMSPLQFALLCTFEYDKKDMSIEILKALKSEDLPIRPHYCWPLLASLEQEKNLKGLLDLLRELQKIDVKPGLNTYFQYIYKIFKDVESPHTVLQESGFQEGFNKMYLSALKSAAYIGNLKGVYIILSSSNIPFVKDISFIHGLQESFARSTDVDHMAKITKLLYQDFAVIQNSLPETDCVGYFLCGMINKMRDSDLGAKEKHLKQYFHQLKEMGILISPYKVGHIIQLLDKRNVPLLIQDLKSLSPSTVKTQGIAELEDMLETRNQDGRFDKEALFNLVSAVVAENDLDKALELKSKYGDEFIFPIWRKLFYLCCSQNKPLEALNILKEAEQKGFTQTPTTGTLLSLFSVLANNGFTEDAINILKEIQERNLPLSDDTGKHFSFILNCLALKGDVDSVYKLQEHIVMMGLSKPTTRLCASLVAVHMERNDLPAALDALMNCLRKYGHGPLFHNLLLKLVQTGDRELLQKAVDQLSFIVGDRAMFHHLLFIFIEYEKYAEAQKIAETPGLRAHAKKMTWFIARCKKLNMVHMLEKFVEITRVVFDTDREEMYYELLSLYDKNDEWTKAIPLWYKMLEEGVDIPQKTVDLLVNIFKKNGESVVAHIPEIANKFTDIDGVDFHSYSNIVLELCQNRNFNEAYSLFLKSKQSQIPLTSRAYRKLIEGLLETNEMENALTVEGVAKTYFSKINLEYISNNLLLAEQVRRDYLKDALVSMEMMLKDQKMLGRMGFNKLTEAFAMRGDVESLEKIEQIAGSLLHHGKFHMQLFNSKLLAHFKNNNFEEATSIMKTYCTQNKNEPLSIAYLLSMLMKNNMSEALEKVRIVAEMLSKRFEVHWPVTELFFLYLKSGKTEEAEHLLQRCDAIRQQNRLIRKHLASQIHSNMDENVFWILDLFSNPAHRTVAYGLMMKRNISSNKAEAASELYKRMQSEQISLDDSTLNLLKAFLKKEGMPVPFSEAQESRNEWESNVSSPPEDDDDDDNDGFFK